MNLYSYEEPVIGRFLQYAMPSTYQQFKLCWDNGSYVIALYLESFEDCNELDDDDPAYEDYTTIWFKVIRVSGTPPLPVHEDEITVNYHTFPNEVWHGSIRVC